MKILIKTLFMLTTLSILFLCVGCNNQNDTDTPKKTEDVVLSVGILPSSAPIPIIIAQEKGFFEKNNVKVDIQKFKSAMDRDTALQTGNLDGIQTDMISLIFNNDNNFKSKMTSVTQGDFKFLVSDSANVNDLSEIYEGSIGISSNTVIEYVADKVISENNLDAEKIKKEAIPKIPTRLEMLQNGKLDFAVLPDPLASVAINNGAKVLTTSTELKLSPAILMFGDDAIKNKKEQLTAFYKAYDEAVEYINTHDLNEFIDIIVEKGDFPESIKDILQLPEYTKATAPTEDDFNKIVEWMKEKELTESNYTFDQVSDFSFLEK